MKKNVAGQFAPSVNLVSAADGSALTTAATIHVTLDNGTPAAGGGTLAYVANRGWSYAPTQAETNADKLTFFYGHASAVGGGVSATVYPSFPQTGDAFTRALNDLDAAGIRAALGLPAADLGTRLDDIPTVAEFNARTKPTADYFDPATDTVTVGTNNDKTGYSISNVSEIAGAVFDEAILGHDIADTFGELLVGIRDATITLESGQGAISTQISDVSAVTSKLNTAMELDGAVYRFTVNALEQAPVGGGGTADWTADEKEAIRVILGIPASGTVPETPADGALFDLLTGVADLPTVAEFEARTKLAADYFDPAVDSVLVSATSVRTAVGMASANLDTQLADIPTVAEMNERTKLTKALGEAQTLRDREVQVGAVDQSIRFVATDAVGNPLIITTASILAVFAYRRYLNGVQISQTGFTETDLPSATAPHTDFGVIHIENGLHRVDLPDDAFAAGADEVRVFLFHNPAVFITVERILLKPVPTGYATPANVTDSQAAIIAAIGTPMQADADVNLAATSLLTMLETDGLVSRFTANALEMAPVDGGGGDTTALEKLMRADVRTEVGTGGQYDLVWYDEADGVTELMRKAAIQPDGTPLTAATQVLGGLI
jgi:hypothetical protein